MEKLSTIFLSAILVLGSTLTGNAQNWSIVTSSTSTSSPIYTGVTYSAPNMWHVCGTQGKVLYSDNYGITWNESSGINSNTIQFNTIEFSTPQIGFLGGVTTTLSIGNYGKFFFTVDGGKTWEDYGTSTSFPRMNAINFPSLFRGYAVANNKVLRTKSGGDTWSYVYTYGSIDLYDIHFPDSLMGFACGELGSIIRSTDGGDTWQTVYSDPSNNDLYSIYFLNKSVGLACGENGTILRTNDGGNNWTKFNTSVTTDFASITFYNSQEGFIVGQGGDILYTNNGGNTYSFVGTPTSNTLNSVSMSAKNQAIAVGFKQTILKFGTLGLSNKTISTLDENTMRVYPNPATSTVNIELAQNLGENATIEIYDMTGKLLHSRPHNLLETNASLNIDFLASGVYTLKVQTETSTFTQQLVKQ